MKAHRVLLATAFLAGPLVWAANANAVTFTIDIGADTTGANPPPTLATGSGSASTNLNMTVPGWTISATGTGIGVLSPPGLLFSDTIDVHTGSAGTLDLFVTETGITAPTGTLAFSSGLNNNAISSLSATESTALGLGAGNVAYGQNTPLFSMPLAPNDTFHNVKVVATGASYTITEEFIITAPAGGGNFDGTIDVAAAVPEPTSLAILGTALFGFGMIVRRRKSV